MVDRPALPFGHGGLPDLPDNGLERVGLAVDGRGQRPAAQGPEPDAAHLRLFAGAAHTHEAQQPETIDFKSASAKNTRSV